MVATSFVHGILVMKALMDILWVDILVHSYVQRIDFSSDTSTTSPKGPLSDGTEDIWAAGLRLWLRLGW